MTATETASPAAVRLWLLPTAGLVPPASWHACLDPAERQRAVRFLRAADRRHFVAAHVLLRLLLAALFDRPPGDWRFTVDARGKPCLEHPPGWSPPTFSISHTPGLVAAAADPAGRPLGIDVEPADRVLAPALARRVLTPDEQALLADLDRESAGRALLHRWVLKEALGKAVGRGMALPFSRVGFAAVDSPVPCFAPAADLGRPADWHIETWPVQDTHLAALAIHGATVEAGTVITATLGAHDLDRRLAQC